MFSLRLLISSTRQKRRRRRREDITPGRQRRKQENFLSPHSLPEIKFIIFYRHLVTIKYCNKKCQGSRSHTVRQTARIYGRIALSEAARVAYVPAHFDLHFAPIWTNLWSLKTLPRRPVASSLTPCHPPPTYWQPTFITLPGKKFLSHHSCRHKSRRAATQVAGAPLFPSESAILMIHQDFSCIDQHHCFSFVMHDGRGWAGKVHIHSWMCAQRLSGA